MSSTKPPPAPLGLPADGPGSLAGLGRRIVAVVLDWVLSTLVATLVFKVPYGSPGPGAFAPLSVFAVENFVLVATLGSTVGHRLLGMRVGALGRATLTPGQALIRTVLLCLFIPAAIWGKDGRGLHDRAAGTVLVRR